jgi:hypothetical protein
LALAAAVFGTIVGTHTGSAEAQARQAVAASGASALSMPPPPAGELSTSPGAMNDDTGGELDPTPMNSVGIGFKMGMAGMGEGKLQFQSNGKSYPGRVDSRRGLTLSVPLQVGGDGFGWMFEPYYSRASVGTTTTDATGQPSGSTDVNLAAYGMYTGPTVNIHVMQPLYLGIGAGIKAAYVASNFFDYGIDAYGRVPVSATYYLANQVALVAELGLGYGVSAYVSQPNIVVTPTGKISKVENDAQFGKSLSWDCSVGVRLP